MEIQFITIGKNQKLFYRVYGNGTKNIILLHGLVGGSWLSDDWVHSITQGNCRCIVLERPGYGESSPILLKNFVDWIPIIQSFIRELAITSAEVIGCCPGAPYSYATALVLPEVLKKSLY